MEHNTAETDEYPMSSQIDPRAMEAWLRAEEKLTQERVGVSHLF